MTECPPHIVPVLLNKVSLIPLAARGDEYEDAVQDAMASVDDDSYRVVFKALALCRTQGFALRGHQIWRRYRRLRDREPIRDALASETYVVYEMSQELDLVFETVEAAVLFKLFWTPE